MMNIFSKITGRTLMQNKTRTIVTIIGVILSTAMITAVTTFAVSFWNFLINYAVEQDGDWFLSAQNVSAGDYADMMKDERITSSAVLSELGFADFPPVQKDSPNMPYLYVQSLPPDITDMVPFQLSDGRLPANDSELLIPAYLLANEDQNHLTRIGDTLTLSIGNRSFDGKRLSPNDAFLNAENSDDETARNEVFTPSYTKSFTVVGIYESYPGTDYSVPAYEVFCGPMKTDAGYYSVFVRLQNPGTAYDVYDEWLSSYDAISVSTNYSLLRWYGSVDNDNFNRIIYGLAAVLIGVIMGGSILLIYNAFSISLRERTVQFGLLSSIGATKKQLRSSVFFEAAVISAVGIPLGILSGVGGIGVTLHFIGKGLTTWIHGVNTGIPLKVSAASILISVGIALITVWLSAWIPSERIRRISPMDAIRSANDIRVRAKDVRTSGIFLRLFHTEGMLARKNYKRDRRKYRTTVLSLTMSIVLFVTSTLFTVYLTKTGAFVLDAPEMELSYSLYNFSNNKNAADRLAEEEKARRILSGDTSVEKVLSFRSFHVFTPIEAANVSDDLLRLASEDQFPRSVDENTIYFQQQLYVLTDKDFAAYAKSQKISPEDYLDSDELRAVFVNLIELYNPDTQRYERRSTFSLDSGAKLTLGEYHYDNFNGSEDFVGSFNDFASITVGASAKELPDIFPTYTPPLALFIPESMYQAHQQELASFCPSLEFMIKCSDYNETFDRLTQAFRNAGLEDDGYLTNLASQYESDRNILMAIDVLTYGFVILISLISIANVFNTISTNLLLRRKEFAMLRSMGMTPKSFQKMLNFECLIYGLRSIFYGVLLSLLISFLLYRILTGGADISFIFPWHSLFIAVAGIFIVVFITMLYTMRKIKNNNIIDELKMN